MGFEISFVTPAPHSFDIWHCCGASRCVAGAAGSDSRPLPLREGSAAPLIYWPTSDRRGTRATTGKNLAESRDKLSSPLGAVRFVEGEANHKSISQAGQRWRPSQTNFIGGGERQKNILLTLEEMVVMDTVTWFREVCSSVPSRNWTKPPPPARQAGDEHVVRNIEWTGFRRCDRLPTGRFGRQVAPVTGAVDSNALLWIDYYFLRSIACVLNPYYCYHYLYYY